MGTSLTVAPANSLVDMAAGSARVVVNTEPVGCDLGLRYGIGKDYLLQGPCDDQIAQLVRMCGWEQDFAAVMAAHQ